MIQKILSRAQDDTLTFGFFGCATNVFPRVYISRIEAVTPLLKSMQAHGYWLSDGIIEHARELADEAGNAGQDND